MIAALMGIAVWVHEKNLQTKGSKQSNVDAMSLCVEGSARGMTATMTPTSTGLKNLHEGKVLPGHAQQAGRKCWRYAPLATLDWLPGRNG